ncbi:hypothetical protein QJQ45_030173 [Haematococcus lacustris]|nr:hypothetical protein QJQ45_030173 [Haematococcus lacustris]
MKILQLQQQLSKPPMSLPHDDAYDQWAQWQHSAPVVRDTGAYHDSCGDSYDDDLQYSNLDQSAVDMDVLQFLNQRQSAAYRKYAGSEAGSVNQGTPLAHRPARAKPLGLAPSRLKVAPLVATPTAARAKPLRLKPHATTATPAGPGSTSSATHAANSQGGTSTTDTSLPSYGLALSSGLAMRFHPNAPNPWQRPAMPSPQRWCDPTLPHQPLGPGTAPHGLQPTLVAQPMHEPHAVKQQPHAGEQQQGGSQGQGGGAQLSGREGQLVQAVLQLEHLLHESREAEAAARARLRTMVSGVKTRGSLARELLSARKAASNGEADRALLQRRVEALQAFLSKEKSAREEAERRLAASEQRGTALSLEVEAGRQQLMQLQQFMDTAGLHQEQFIHAANKVAAAAAVRMQRLSSRLARARTALAACQAELSCCQTQRNLSEQQVAGLQAALEQLYVGKIGSEQLAQLQQQLAEQQAALLHQHQLQLQQRQQQEEEQQLLDRQSLQQPPHPPHQPTQEGQGEGVPQPPPFHTSSLAQDELPEDQLRQSNEQQQQCQGEKWAGGCQPGSALDPFADSDSSGSSGPGGSRQEVHSPLALRVLGAALKQLGIHTHPPIHPTARRPGPTAPGTTASWPGGQSGSRNPHSPTGGAVGNVLSKHRTMAGVAAQTAALHVPARPAPGFVAAMAAAAAADEGDEDRNRRAKATGAAAAAAAAGSSEAASHTTLRPSMPGVAEAGGGLLRKGAQPAAMQQPSTHSVAEAGDDDDDDDEEEEQEAGKGAHVKGGQAALRARRAMRVGGLWRGAAAPCTALACLHPDPAAMSTPPDPADPLALLPLPLPQSPQPSPTRQHTALHHPTQADRATTLRPRLALASQTKTARPTPGRPQPRPQPALSRSDSDTASSGGKPRSRGRGKEAGGGAAWQQPDVPTRLQAPDQATGGSSAALCGHPEPPPATESSIRQQQPVSVVDVGEQQAVRPGSNPAASVQPGRQLADLQQLLALLQGTALTSSGSPGAVSAAVGAAKPPAAVRPGGGTAGVAPSLPEETLPFPHTDQQQQLSSSTSQSAGLGQHPTQPAQLPPNAAAATAAPIRAHPCLPNPTQAGWQGYSTGGGGGWGVRGACAGGGDGHGGGAGGCGGWEGNGEVRQGHPPLQNDSEGQAAGATGTGRLSMVPPQPLHQLAPPGLPAPPPDHTTSHQLVQGPGGGSASTEGLTPCHSSSPSSSAASGLGGLRGRQHTALHHPTQADRATTLRPRPSPRRSPGRGRQLLGRTRGAGARPQAPASSPAPHHVTLEGLGGTKPNPSVLSILRQHEQAVAASSAFGSTCRPGQPAAALGVQAALACWAEQPGRRRGPKELDSSPDCSDSRPAAGLEAGRAQLGRAVGQEGASGSDSEEGVGGRVRLLRGDWPVLLSGRKARPGVKGGRGGQGGHSQRSPSKAGLRSSAGLGTGTHSPASSPRHNGRGPAVWGRQSDGGHHLLAQLKLPEAPAGVHNGIAQKNTLLLGTGGTAAASSNAVLVAKEERKGGIEACLLRAGVRQEDAQLRRPSQLQRLGLLPRAWDVAGSDNTDAEPTCSAPGTALVSHSSADIVPNRATSSVMTRPLVVATGASSAGLNAGMAASAAIFAALSESDVTDSGAGRNPLSYAIPRLPLGGARGSALANALAHPGPTAGRANAEPAACVSEASSPDHGPHSRMPHRPAASSSSAQTSPSGVRPGSGKVVRRGVHSPSSQWARCPAKVQPQARGSACPVKAGAKASHGTASLSPGCSSGRPSPGAAARPRSAKQPGGAQGMGSTAPLAPAESFSQPHAAPVEGSGPGSAVRRATTDGGPGVASLLVQARQLAAGFAALANTGKQRKL